MQQRSLREDRLELPLWWFSGAILVGRLVCSVWSALTIPAWELASQARHLRPEFVARTDQVLDFAVRLITLVEIGLALGLGALQRGRQAVPLLVRGEEIVALGSDLVELPL
jgi:hypothetical protein